MPVLVDDALELWVFVVARDHEATRMTTDGFVFVGRKREGFRAGAVSTLADERLGASVFFEPFLEFLDLLIDLAKGPPRSGLLVSPVRQESLRSGPTRASARW